MIRSLLAAQRILNDDIEYQGLQLRAKHAWDLERHELHALMVLKADNRATELGMVSVAGFWSYSAPVIREAKAA